MTQKKVERKYRTKAQYASPKGLASKVDQVEKNWSLFPQSVPEFKAGDTIKVHVWIREGGKERVQVFQGVCIKKRNRGANSSFVVRKSSQGIGVERVFLMNSPKIAKVEVVDRGLVRRAKLYTLRKLSGKAARIPSDVKANEAARRAQRQKQQATR